MAKWKENRSQIKWAKVKAIPKKSTSKKWNECRNQVEERMKTTNGHDQWSTYFLHLMFDVWIGLLPTLRYAISLYRHQSMCCICYGFFVFHICFRIQYCVKCGVDWNIQFTNNFPINVYRKQSFFLSFGRQNDRNNERIKFPNNANINRCNFYIRSPGWNRRNLQTKLLLFWRGFGMHYSMHMQNSLIFTSIIKRKYKMKRKNNSINFT